MRQKTAHYIYVCDRHQHYNAVQSLFRLYLELYLVIVDILVLSRQICYFKVFHITNPQFNEQIHLVPSDFVESRFHCTRVLYLSLYMLLNRYTRTYIAYRKEYCLCGLTPPTLSTLIFIEKNNSLGPSATILYLLEESFIEIKAKVTIFLIRTFRLLHRPSFEGAS